MADGGGDAAAQRLRAPLLAADCDDDPEAPAPLQPRQQPPLRPSVHDATGASGGGGTVRWRAAAASAVALRRVSELKHHNHADRSGGAVLPGLDVKRGDGRGGADYARMFDTGAGAPPVDVAVSIIDYCK